MKTQKTARRLGKGALVLALAGSMSVCGAGVALAMDPASGSVNASSEAVATPDTLLTTSSVRAGSAGPDFLGITNTNYDFQPSHTAKAGDPYPYYYESNGKGWGADLAKADQFNRLAIWGTGVNENANPYYQNLLVNWLLDTDYKDNQGALPAGYTMATTYHSNKETSSWGDVTVDDKYAPGIISQDVVFGANKYTNWNSSYGYGLYTQTAENNKDALYTNNDSTNLWTQIYTAEQLASDVDGLDAVSKGTETLRYGDATTNAVNYEKAIKGQMLYVASQIETNQAQKKTVAYLYAIDADGTAYFFVPGTDTAGSTSGNTSTSTKAAADTDYVSNNSTINMGYMATLPFVTNTFDSGTEFTDANGNKGIVMKVEDIYKTNPTCTVSASDATAAKALENVDVIIYNSTKYTGYDSATEDGTAGSTQAGTNNGRNSSGVGNAAALNESVISTWYKGVTGKDYAGSLIAGDDFGTSTQQQTNMESCPILYCARNYTLDKDTRAAWVFSKVFPEYYGDNDDATYAYWVENIYHVASDQVANVVAAMTHQNADDVKIYANNTATLNSFAETGYAWYQNLASNSVYKTDYAYYTGATRAYWYTTEKNLTEAAESVGQENKYTVEQINANNVLTTGTVGIFAPSAAWTAADTHFKTFTDVPAGKWYTDVIGAAVNLGIFNGYKDGTFGPDKTITRAELVGALWNYYEPENSNAYVAEVNKTGMKDVESNAWYTGAANWAVANGVISGYADGTFAPNDLITRDQACAIIANAATKYAGAEVVGSDQTILKSMPDASSVESWATDSVAWCLNNGVISGKETGMTRTVSPLDKVTRAEIAAITVQANDNGLLKK